MITSRGDNTKVLSKKHLKYRRIAIRNPESIDPDQRPILDVDDVERLNKENPESYKIMTEPLDFWDYPRRVDIRNLKGGKTDGKRKNKFR